MIIALTQPYFRIVAETHIALDPTAFLSEIKEIGITFREKIFYPTLAHDPDSFVWLYFSNDALAGYIVGTKDVGVFYRRLKRRHPLLLAQLLLLAVFRKPGLLVQYARSAIRLEQTFSKQHAKAEILSLGVLPQFRTDGFEQRHGIHVAEELFQKALGTFRRWGIRNFSVMTLQENKAANRFYEKHGCRLAGITRPFGKPCNVFIGDL